MNRSRLKFASSIVELMIILSVFALFAALAIPRAGAGPVARLPVAQLAEADTAASSPESASDPAPAPSASGDSVLLKIGSDLKSFFHDNTNLFNQGVVIVEAGALYNAGNVGGFVDVQFPIEQQLSLGFAVAYLDHNFYDAALSARLGTTWDVPILGPVYTYFESGPGYNLKKSQIVEQSFAGALWKKQLSEKCAITIGGAVGHISDLTGPVIAAGASVSYKFK